MNQHPEKMSSVSWMRDYERRITALERASQTLTATRITYIRGSVPANVSDIFMAADEVFGIEGQRFPWNGAIIGMSASFSSPITAGSVLLRPHVEDQPMNLSCLLEAGAEARETFASQGSGIDPFPAGSLLRVAFTTPAGFTPAGSSTNSNLLVSLYVRRLS